MNNNFGSLTWERIVSHIEKNYKCLHLINGIQNILLYDYQKYIVKQIINNNNTLTMTSRQMGLTSLYCWTMQAIALLLKETNILYLTYKKHSALCINRILNINISSDYSRKRGPITLSNFSRLWPTNFTQLPMRSKFDYVFVLFNVSIKELFENIMTNIISLSNNIHVSFNKPREWSNEYLRSIWKNSLILNGNFKAIYLPWYLQENRKLNFLKNKKECLGLIQFTREFLA